MNKLSALYNMIKVIKESDACGGKLSAEVKLDDLSLATVNTQGNCTKERCAKQVEVRFGQEVLKLEHEGTKSFHAMLHGHRHGHDRCCSGGKFEKALFLLRALEMLNLQELENGKKVLSLIMPGEELPKHLKNHLRSCCSTSSGCCEKEGHQKFHSWLNQCGCLDLNFESLEIQNISIKLSLSDACAPEEIAAVITAKVSDKDNSIKTVSITIQGQTA